MRHLSTRKQKMVTNGYKMVTKWLQNGYKMVTEKCQKTPKNLYAKIVTLNAVKRVIIQDIYPLIYINDSKW